MASHAPKESASRQQWQFVIFVHSNGLKFGPVWRAGLLIGTRGVEIARLHNRHAVGIDVLAERRVDFVGCECLDSGLEIRGGRDGRAVGRRVRNVVADGPVGRLELRLGRADEIGRHDILQPVVLKEHEAPVALRDGAVQDPGRDGL